jgi:hypothetical protein
MAPFLIGKSRTCGIMVVWAAGMVGMAMITPAHATQTRSYAVNWLEAASYTRDENCPNGINPPNDVQYRKDFAALGIPAADIERLFKAQAEGGRGSSELEELINNRARIHGKAYNTFTNPQATIDPHLISAVGRFAYGFNLDGKGAKSPNGFEDPDTHEKGVNNEFFRAVGCIEAFRGVVATNTRPAYWQWVWQTMRLDQPAWLITISGETLTKDGDVTVTFDRALEHVALNAGGEARPYMTYRIDPDVRSHNVFKGRITQGVLEITEHTKFHMLENTWGTPELDLHNFHLRIRTHSDDTIDAILGGTQNWHQLYFQLANSGLDRESTTGSLPGIYYLLKKFADAEYSEKKKENTAISITYHLDAVPAFVAPPQMAQMEAPK